MQTQPYQGTVDANGSLIISIQPFGLSNMKWVVKQISTKMKNAPAGSQCIINLNGYPVTPMPAQVGTASREPYIELGAFDRLTVEWTLATPGLIGLVQVFYDTIPDETLRYLTAG